VWPPCRTNNVVGERLLVAADLNHEADELAREMALRTETQRRRSTDSPEELAVLQQRVRKVLVGPTGGQWAADCVLRALAKRGFYAHRRSAAEFTFVGDWLLFGDKFHHADRPWAGTPPTNLQDAMDRLADAFYLFTGMTPIP
jgi:hypothetical protein